MSVPPDTPPLTREQRAAVEQPAEAQVLITAGPGSGKTHTLIRRIDFLVSKADVLPAEIQVLTFSRAAVRELRERLSASGGSARNVRAQTFDGWALALLKHVDASTVWEEQSFDHRIEQASRAIEDGRADEELVGELTHLVVDEVQDLVGARRELVEALIDSCSPGFTLVGDPAQSIYEFSTRSADTSETGRFFTWVQRTFADDLVELSLTGTFRAGTDAARTALKHGPALQELALSGEKDDRGLHEELRGSLRGTLNLGLDTFGLSVLRRHEGKSGAVLCRTNGAALEISEALWAAGVDHELQRSSQDRGSAPPWLATLFHEVDGTLLRRRRFGEILEAEVGCPDEEIDRIWQGLRRITGDRRSSNTIGLPGLRRALAQGKLSGEFATRRRSNLVVSSFHRAKGLEFDRVFVLDPGETRAGRNSKKRHDPAEEARLLYVAMTRARSELLHFPAFTVNVRSVKKDKNSGDRWGRFHSGEKWMRLGLELTGRDVDARRPPGTGLGHDPVSVQKHLAEHVRPGDEITLERLRPEADQRFRSPPYAVVHQGHPIGEVSDLFRDALYRFLAVRPGFVPWNWPRTVRKVRIDALESVAGSEAAGERAGLGPHGVWLAPRLSGLSRFEYDNKSDGAAR